MRYIIENARTFRDTWLLYLWWAYTEFKARFPQKRLIEKAAPRTALLLAWALPPVVAGGVYRPTSFLRYGHCYGWGLTAISGPWRATGHETGEYLQKKIPASVRVFHVQPPQLVSSWRFSPRVDGGFANALATFELARQVLRNDPPSVVIASGPPFHNFIAAYYLARYFRSKLVLDYRDEWNECPFGFVEPGNLDQWMERRCLKRADAVLFTTKSQLAHQVNVFPCLDQAKCHVIANGWEPSDFTAACPRGGGERVREADIVLSFLGNLGDHTDLLGFISNLEIVFRKRQDLADRVVVRLVGPKSPAILQLLGSWFGRVRLETVGLVPKPEALDLMRKSNALLLFCDERFARYLPGKAYEYIAARQPIIVIGAPGEASELVERLSVGIFVPSRDPEAMIRAIDGIQGRSEKIHDNAEPLTEWLQNHTRQKLAEAFFVILAGLFSNDVESSTS